ncbi:MAG TPA: BTAD domain-containing putative transcriptional regulator [Gaiellaceae bacterium]
MLEFRILGPLEVERDGTPVEITGGRQRAVLALLLLEANRVVPTERLVDRLWGEEPPPTAVTSLHNAVSQLRKLLGAETLETRAPGYVLRADPESLDLTRFERLLREARGAPAADRSRLLQEALDVWRGPPLAEFAYDAFAQSEVRRLEELRLTALEDRIDAELEAGRANEVVPELESLVAAEPHRERLRTQLMLALYRTGRQGDALQAYQDARRTLADDLGIDPGPALRGLHGAILRQEPSLDLRPTVMQASTGPSPDHVADVVAGLLGGRVVPVLGMDAEDIAIRLAERFRYPDDEPAELPRVSQFAAVTRGYGPLYDELHALAEADGEPSSVHRFFAALPPLLRERGAPHQLLVTTSYGRALERAFADAGEEVDVVSYIAAGRSRGKFCHQAPDGSARVIDLPNTYAAELSLERRTVILKVRGQADPEREWESFVVTEDDYIDYLGRGDVAGAVPVGLAATLRRSHFLFLGYTMRDWNLRLVLGRMWGEHPLTYRSWAVHPEPRAAERELWRRVDVDLVEATLDVYVDTLADASGVGAAVA